jgi:hypothetical protein
VSHTQHSCTDLLRQRVYQIAAGYEDCNDANELRKDPALRLALDQNNAYAASQSVLSRFENKILGNRQGLHALDGVLQRSIDSLLKREGKARLILDLDSSEDPAHGRQEGVNYNGHFRKNCYHPLFCFTSSGICLAGKLREGNVHSAHGALEMLSPDRGEIPEALQAILAPWGRSLCQARTLCLLRGKEDDLLHPAEIEQHPEKTH